MLSPSLPPRYRYSQGLGKGHQTSDGDEVSGLGQLPGGEELFRTAFEYAPIGMAIADRNGRWLRVNPAFAEMLGYEASELVDRLPAEVTHPDDVAESVGARKRLWAGEISSASLEKRYVRRDGAVIWASLHISVVPGPQGQPVCAIAQIENITARRQWAEQLERRDSILEAVSAGAAQLLELPSWDAAIDEVLTRLGRAANVSRVHLFELVDGRAALRHHAEWAAPGVPPGIERSAVLALSLELPGASQWLKTFAAGGVVQAHARDLAEPMRSLVAADVRSLLLVPVFAGRELWGLFGLDECGAERVFAPPEISALRAAAVALGSAVARQRAEQSRQQVQEQYRTLIENLPLTTYIDHADATASAVYISPQIENVLGYPPQAWLDDPGFFQRVLHPDDRAEFERTDWPEGAGPHAADYRMVSKDGRIVWIHDEFHVVTGPDDERYTRGFMIDVTERKQTEEALRQTNETLRALVDAAPVAIIASDLDDRVTLWNEAAERMFGWPSHEVVGQALPIRPAGLETEHAAIRQSITAGQSLQALETRRLRRDGSTLDVSVSYAPLYDERGGVVGMLAICADVSDRKRAELALRERERRFRTVFDAARDTMMILDDDRSLLDVNDAAARLYGIAKDDLVGQSIDALSPGAHAEVLDQIWARCFEQGETSGDWELVRPDRATRHVEYSLKANVLPGRHLMTLRDVTDRRQLEAQLLRSQRMEAVGRLAGGIAHDFNNLLTAITGYSDFLLQELEPDSTALSDAQEIARAADRAASLVNQLLAFSRRQVTRSRVLDLNDIVREAETMLRRLVGEDIALSTRLGSVPAVAADPAQMEQMIINLAVNSRDAMPDGGTLEIATSTVELSAEDGARLALPPGTYAHIRVVDDGSGMDEPTRLQAFEPFFTTKENGTGLGLSTVYGIVTGAGGQVELDSEVGHGTAFSIYLPVTTRVGESDNGAPTTAAVRGGTETVLLVEDDDVVRQLAMRVLAGGGYRVLQAACGEEALEVAAAATEPIHVLLTDVVMPGIGGRELADRVREQRPETRVVFMSGYTEDPTLRSRDDTPLEVFVAKPFTPATLARGVRAALE